MNIWDSLPRPILALAPMSGYTDSPFRRIIKEICPSVVCFTEFTSVDGILHKNSATFRQMSFNKEKERPIIAQIFGKKPENIKIATEVISELGFDGIDINMGCPARKIVNSDHGSALLKNPDLAEEIVRVATAATRLPVSVKMRLGVSRLDMEAFLDFGKRMQSAGAKLITVHGRLAKQMYSGNANWDPIYELKKILKIPVIGNGDIKSGQDALDRLKNLDGVMVGRACFGNPWLMADVAAKLKGEKFSYPLPHEKLPVILRHIELSCESKGEHYGIVEMRKHLAFYVRGMPNASVLRSKLVKVNTQKEAVELLKSFFA